MHVTVLKHFPQSVDYSSSTVVMMFTKANVTVDLIAVGLCITNEVDILNVKKIVSAIFYSLHPHIFALTALYILIYLH